MIYRLCNNGRAVLLTREVQILKEALCIELTATGEEKYTVIIKTGEKTYYRPVENRTAELKKELIEPGAISISIIKNDEIKATWACDELYATVDGDVVVVGGNTLQYDNLLNELRVENDVYRERMTALEKKVDELSRHYEEIYAGYEQL